MTINIFSRLNFVTCLVIIFSIFLLAGTSDANAARKKKKRATKKVRTYNPSFTKKQALEMISSNSEKLSNLAGIEANIQNSNLLNTEEESELLDDAETHIAPNANIDEEAVGDYGEDLDELEASDDVKIDINDFNTLWMAYFSAGDDDEQTDSGISKQELMDNIMDWIGTPYLFGGSSRKAIDCSAFTRSIYLSSAESLIPRTAREQFQLGKKVNRNNLKFGDLIFFNTRKYAYASHVGIYLGDNLFAHASSRYGVTVSSLESSYYKRKFIGGRRYSSKELERMAINPEKAKDYIQ